MAARIKILLFQRVIKFISYCFKYLKSWQLFQTTTGQHQQWVSFILCSRFILQFYICLKFGTVFQRFLKSGADVNAKFGRELQYYLQCLKLTQRLIIVLNICQRNVVWNWFSTRHSLLLLTPVRASKGLE